MYQCTLLFCCYLSSKHLKIQCLPVYLSFFHPLGLWTVRHQAYLLQLSSITTLLRDVLYRFSVLRCTSRNLSAFFDLFKATLRILHWSLPGPADEEIFYVITPQCKITSIHTSHKINHLHGTTLEGTSQLGDKHLNDLPLLQIHTSSTESRTHFSVFLLLLMDFHRNRVTSVPPC